MHSLNVGAGLMCLMLQDQLLQVEHGLLMVGLKKHDEITTFNSQFNSGNIKSYFHIPSFRNTEIHVVAIIPVTNLFLQDLLAQSQSKGINNYGIYLTWNIPILARKRLISSD